MTISQAERDRRYQRLFDGFVRLHKLDIEFDNWPAKAEKLWAAEVKKFNEAFPTPVASIE